MPLADLLLKQFGVKTEPVENPLVSSIDTGVTKVLANNPNRLGWIIINLSTSVLNLALKSDVSASKGVRLFASGGMASMVWNEDFQATGYEVFMYSPADSCAIYVLEVQESLK